MGDRNAGLNLFAGIPPLADIQTTGRVFFLGNSTTYVPGGIAGVDHTSYGDTPQRPFATWDYAVSQCTANRGDVIVINPAHAETIATATALDIDVAGVRTIGLGTGANRPTFTVGTVATATITFSAANTITKNIVVVSALDGLNTAITVTGANVELDIEHQDTSAAVEADIAITASGANFRCKLRDVGFTTGNQREASISMNGVVGARIDIDQYGIPATAVVNFVTTLCSDVEVRGTTYVSGTTDGSKNVVDTVGSSLWYMDIIDAAAGSRYTGGSGAAVASDDISAVNSVLGTVATAAATGAVTATDNAMSYIKQLVTELAVVDEFHDVPSADATANAQINEVVGNKTDAAQVTVGTTRSLVGYLKGLMNSTIRTIEKTDGTVTGTADALFTITGGPIRAKSIIGIVTTVIGAVAANGTLQATVTEPAGTVALSTTVAITDDAAGTMYHFVGATGVLTPVTVGAAILDLGSATVAQAEWIIPIGNINFLTSASNTGVIKWYMTYEPLSPSAVVVAAA